MILGLIRIKFRNAGNLWPAFRSGKQLFSVLVKEMNNVAGILS